MLHSFLTSKDLWKMIDSAKKFLTRWSWCNTRFPVTMTTLWLCETKDQATGSSKTGLVNLCPPLLWLLLLTRLSLPAAKKQSLLVRIHSVRFLANSYWNVSSLYGRVRVCMCVLYAERYYCLLCYCKSRTNHKGLLIRLIDWYVGT